MVDSIRTSHSRIVCEDNKTKYLATTVSRLSTESDFRLTKGSEYYVTDRETWGFISKGGIENQSNRPSVDHRKPMNFAGEKIIGNGSFGVVYQARVAETGEVVAVKKVFQDRRYKNRELQIMQELDHCNIVKLKYSFITQEEFEEAKLNLVMDYLPETLYRVFKKYKKMKQTFPNLLIKLYSYQMFRALTYIHSKNIVHRDFKPQNLLVDPSTHILKVCDFGSSKKLTPGENNVAYICSRYYRAPELIFGQTNYSTAIDIWSAGCVIAEILLGEPLFPGDSSLNQLIEIIKILGAPTNDQLLKMNAVNIEQYKFPKIQAKSWKKVFSSKTDPLVIDLLSKILVYSPETRLTPKEALLHPYFDELRNQSCSIDGKSLPDLFNFTQAELLNQPELNEKLVPDWYKVGKEAY